MNIEKVILKVNLKTNEQIYPKGSVFFPPLPDAIEREIKAGVGLEVLEIIEVSPEPAAMVDRLDNNQALINQMFPEDEPELSEAEEKLQLANYAMDKFGVKLDRRKTVEIMKAKIEELETTV